MTDVVDSFLAFCRQSSPRFLLKAPEVGELLVENIQFSPASTEELSALNNKLSSVSPELLYLYKQANGMRIFADKDDNDDCFFFVPISEMQYEHSQVEEWMPLGMERGEYYEEELDDEPLVLNGIPPWGGSAIVFAGIGYSPERFFMPLDGAHAGKIFIFEHDGGYSGLVAENFHEFIKNVMENPASFYSRYGGSGAEYASYQTGG